MPDPRPGTVTLLFSDIEGSTPLLQRLGSADYSRVLGDHHAIVRAALAESHSAEVKCPTRVADPAPWLLRRQDNCGGHL